MRNFHVAGRSPVYAEQGMIATSHPLASAAGLAALQKGGTAADAAIAAVAVMSVVEPQMTGIGGDCFALIATPNQPIWGYNGSGRAPHALSASLLRAQGLTKIALDSPHSVTVPGAVEAWEVILQTHGKLGLAQALTPAIHYASQGWHVAPRVAFDWAEATPRLTPALLPVPKAGEKRINPHLARTLQLIADKGAKGFYEGEVAQDIVKTLQSLGGVMTLEDLSTHKGSVETPLMGSYRGVQIAELPPNGQGITALILLNILENFNFSPEEINSPRHHHLLLEAARLAYSLRDTYISDPANMHVSPAQLLDKTYAQKLAAMIAPNQRTPRLIPPPPGTDTIYLACVDKDGMAVSFINSVFHAFGSCHVTPQTGIILQNRGASFSLEQGHVNELQGSKRPMHTIIPAMLIKDGLASPFGVMGGSYQAVGHAHLVQNLVDFGQDPQEALDTPRCFFEGEETVVENSFTPAMQQALVDKGHALKVQKGPIGGGQIILRAASGLLIGASDGRKDGCAIGY